MIEDENHHFDTLITDYKLAHMTGVDLIKKLMSTSKFKNYIILSSEADTNDEIQDFCKQNQKVNSLAKPFNEKNFSIFSRKFRVK